MFQKLSVSSGKRHLVNQDGTPFFYLGDTAWELFHKLNKEEAIEYLDHRANFGFTAIQAVALAELDGLAIPNAYGRHPLCKNSEGYYDPLLPDLDGEYNYWDHVDFIVDEAEKRGLYIAMLPTWGDKFNCSDWGIGPEIFNKENAYAYGKWIGTRYAAKPNIIWVLGGDRPLQTAKHFEVILGMAQGLRDADNGAHLITFHPCGRQSSSTPLHAETIIDFNMTQSGHGRMHENYKMMEHDYSLLPTKPVLDAEPGYEGHPDEFRPANGYLDETDVRMFAYTALFAGACGHTYGHHSIWAFASREMPTFQLNHFCMPWQQALRAPGAEQMHYAKELMLSRDWLNGKPAQHLLAEQYEGLNHISVFAGPGYLYAYSAQGAPIVLKSEAVQGTTHSIKWYNPRNGEYHEEGICEGKDLLKFYPPTGGRNNDWILVLEKI